MPHTLIHYNSTVNVLRTNPPVLTYPNPCPIHAPPVLYL
ncbi:unnamed protein product [Chondrus crispus]|uniref:Uncharacterized protein n=1 Tax=Chondrus crispus TaxID=2769 RepID=R7QE87_CHOCR|nr:unnamed protein product [Chondrus crispus]CDF35771.1 unnamed protein product [Chondrus crispus]|eukprot:XP_005715590.1 unnamed protein product [Chondrus crispus]